MRNPLRLFKYGVAGWFPGGARFCVLCGHRVWRFMPYRGGSRHSPPLMAALESIGSDVDNFECPRCGSHDRERHLYLYMEAAGILECLSSMRVLHFAPENHLSRIIEQANPMEYIRCDLQPTAPEIERINIERMPFQDQSFDLVIANHVLEHVSDDILATREVHRVLAAGGLAVLQTPYSPVLHVTWSDAGIASDQARLQAFGQEDHVRLFGRDIFDRFSESGLMAEAHDHCDLLAEVDARRLGVNPREPFFLFRRDT